MLKFDMVLISKESIGNETETSSRAGNLFKLDAARDKITGGQKSRETSALSCSFAVVRV